MRAWHVTAIEELELSSREADELSGRVDPLDDGELSAVAELLIVAELSIESDPLPPLLSEEFSSISGRPALFALLLSSQAASVKASAAAASPQAIFVRCFMVFLLLRVLSICS